MNQADREAPVLSRSDKQEQHRRVRKWNRMFIERDLIMSPAWWALKSATACRIYLIFRGKCVMEKCFGRAAKDRKDAYRIANNGEIEFTYAEAEHKYGIDRQTFCRNRDDLIRVGLIDIASEGQGVHKDKTLYSISDRWRAFGTPDFKEVIRPKRRNGLGFRKGNRLGQQCQPKKDASVADDTRPPLPTTLNR